MLDMIIESNRNLYHLFLVLLLDLYMGRSDAHSECHGGSRFISVEGDALYFANL